MKQSIFAFLISCVTIAPMWANKIQDAVLEGYRELNPKYGLSVQQQHDLIKNFNSTNWEIFFTDSEQEARRDALRQDPKSKKFLEDFFVLEAEARGMRFCILCLQDIQNPNTEDLDSCRSKWLESDDCKKSLRVASNNEEALRLNDYSLRNAFHRGNRLFAQRIDTIIKENFEEK